MKPVGRIKTIDIDAAKAWEIEHAAMLTELEWTKYGSGLQGALRKDDEDWKSALRLQIRFFTSTDSSEFRTFQAVYERVLAGKAEMPVYHVGEDFIVVRYSKSVNDGVVVPKQFCQIEMAQSPVDFLNSIPANSSLPVSAANGLPSLISKVSANIDGFTAQKLLIQKAEEELAAKEKQLRAEMESKLLALRVAAEEQLAKLNEMKEKYEREFFVLENRIDILRSLLGDNYTLLHLREGEREPEATPLVIYQKLRYLDEDFARISIMAGESKVMFNYNHFDEAIAKQDALFDYFCPSKKCISAVRISADGHYYAKAEEGGNILARYEVENGNNLCLLVRDGQSLYGLWCDDNITLEENLLPSRAEAPIQVPEAKDCTAKKIKFIFREAIARELIYNILAGLAEYRNPPLLLIEGGFTSDNPNIVFSTADGWLQDNRPEFAQLAHSLNLLTKVGDYILPLDSIDGYHEYTGDWKHTENRGRGSNALAHDASIPNTVVQVSLIEAEQEMESYEYREHFSELDSYVDRHPESITELLDRFESAYSADYGYPPCVSIKVPCPAFKIKDEYTGPYAERYRKEDEKAANREYIARLFMYSSSAGAGYTWKPECEGILPKGRGRWRTSGKPHPRVSMKLTPEEYSVYVSCKKEYSQKDARANVKIEHSEFLNLTYLSSETILYYISSKKLGSAFGKNFASNVAMLKKALDFIRAREQTVMVILNRVASRKLNQQDILPKLYEWQKENEVRAITDFQAKRFLKTINLM